MMNYARNPEVKSVKEILNIAKPVPSIEKSLYEQVEASTKKMQEVYTLFREKNVAFPVCFFFIHKRNYLIRLILIVY
jgi:hypothetical protein